MNQHFRGALVLGALITLSACATVTRGTKQEFYILSEPSGGKVTTTSGVHCTTPCKVKIKRKTEFKASITKSGYKPGTADVESSTHGGGATGAAGNIIAGGVIGIFVDGSNGSMNDLRPNPLKWVLAPEGSADETKVVSADKPKDMKDVKAERFDAKKPKADKNVAPAADTAPAPTPPAN